MKNNDKPIDWGMIECLEVLKGNWQVVALEGYDEDGNYYTASMETFISNPLIIEENITDIERHD